jgi:TetR/AcrR family transcriptional repressor for divergent bdcA
VSRPGPSKQFDRDKALQAGLALFWKRGFSDVSMNELLSGMGIGRQSFYNTFRSKSALFDEAIALYVEQYQRPLLEQLSSHRSADVGVLAFLGHWERSAESRPNDGCFLVNTCDDYPSLAKPSIQLVTSAMSRLEQSLAGTIAEAIEMREICSRLSSEELAKILTLLGYGMMIAARSSRHQASDGTSPRNSGDGLLTQTYLQLTNPGIASKAKNE